MGKPNILRQIQSVPFYPLLFIAYPAVALMGININEVEPIFLWRPLLVLVLTASVLFVLLRFLLRDWHRAAVSLSILILLFFTYGHLYLYLKKIEIAGIIIGRHRLMLPVWIALAALGIWWAVRVLRDARSLTPILNTISIFLLIYPSFQITSYVIQKQKAQKAALAAAQLKATSLPLGYAPDIYYIILDAYGRQDVLKEMFGYDNSPFINYLQSKGFYVPKCSQSNYGQTMLSLTSSLNYDYLDNLTNELTPNTDQRAPLRALGQYNRVRRFLKSQGYNIVSFATDFPVSEWKDADYFLTLPSKGMRDFEIMLAQTSAWRIPMDMSNGSPEKRSAEWFRRRTLSALGHLEETVPGIPSPKFVFAHLVIPHHPFVFGPNGEKRTYENNNVPPFNEYKVKYPDQVTYINKRIETIVDMILKNSAKPPIIIIQGDHGPAPFDVIERRMKNLNSYYFPDQNYTALYPTITPVNTFRIILDQYFNQQLPLLKDRSLFSEYDVPYNYVEVPNTCQP